MAKVSWGVLSTANIGTGKVIPAMQKGEYTAIDAIASRDLNKAKQTAKNLGIPKAYGSYEELLADKEITAIYIPLPNHLHVEWTIKSLKAGKHVLCEKPIGMNYDEAVYLQNEIKNFPKLKVMEAFMYRHHPQMQKVKELIKNGKIGDLRTIHTMFTYYNDNPDDIRNMADIGGGGLLDIGCYCISISRFLFDAEPKQVCANIEYDPKLKTDRLVSSILKFEKGDALFTCSTQLEYHQFAKVLGTKGKIEIETPFTPSFFNDEKITLKSGDDIEEIIFKPRNHYTIQGDMFSQAILNDTEVFTPFSDAVANMKVIDKIIESNKKKMWVDV
jgi:predicted dehydrogenase